MMSETLNFSIMIYLDLIQTVSSEELYYNFRTRFWAGAVPTVEKMKLEEFEQALDYFTQCVGSPIDRTCLNDFFWFTEDEEWEQIIGRKLWED